MSASSGVTQSSRTGWCRAYRRELTQTGLQVWGGSPATRNAVGHWWTTIIAYLVKHTEPSGTDDAENDRQALGKLRRARGGVLAQADTKGMYPPPSSFVSHIAAADVKLTQPPTGAKPAIKRKAGGGAGIMVYQDENDGGAPLLAGTGAWAQLQSEEQGSKENQQAPSAWIGQQVCSRLRCTLG